MGLKSDCWIRQQDENMIVPFVGRQVRSVDGRGVVSFGTSSYGYDISLADEIKVFVAMPGVVIDPKNFDPRLLVDVYPQESASGRYIDIPPHSFALARTVEKFRIPNNVLTICLGKSTYARCGQILNVTPFQPGWSGYATLEITNSTPCPARFYIGEGIGQVLFFEGDEIPENGYGDGPYSDQEDGIVLPKVYGHPVYDVTYER